MKFTVDTIIALLGIDGCPDILKNADKNLGEDTYFGFRINNFKKYLKNETLQTLTIITHTQKKQIQM